MAVSVSVIMPTYNCGNYIAASIDSVIAQTFTDWEIEIADDCSTDNTVEILRPYLEKYPNIHYSRLPQNGGPAAARNEAIRRASGKYCSGRRISWKNRSLSWKKQGRYSAAQLTGRLTPTAMIFIQ